MVTQVEVYNKLDEAKRKYESYQFFSKNQASNVDYAQTIKNRRLTLENSLKRLDDVEATYTKEYLERADSRPGFLESRGLLTNADWALALFYISYIAAAVITVLYIYKNSKTPTKGVALSVAFFTVMGIMMSAVLLRFA
jgi:hypothetical protein